MLSRAEQLSKALFEIVSSPSLSVIVLREVHPEKVYSAILVTLVGIETLSSAAQPEKAYVPISRIEFGIVMLFRVVLSLNAFASIPNTGRASLI